MLHNITAICLWITVAGSVTAGELLSSVVQVPDAIYTSDFDPDSGTLAMVTAGADRLYLLPDAGAVGGAARLISVDVGRRPVAVACKVLRGRSVFAVVCSDDLTLHVISADGSKTLGKVVLGGTAPTSVAASRDPADPYVYYFHSRSLDSRVARINLESMQDEGPVPGMTSAMDGVVSVDGALMYVRGPHHPSGRMVWRLPRGNDGQARLLSGRHEEADPYHLDPFGRTVAIGDRLFSADLERELATLPFAVRLFCARRPVAFGVDEGGLSAVSTNTWRRIGSWRIDVPEAVHQQGDPGPPQDSRPAAASPRMYEDARHGSLIVAGGEQVQRISVDSLGLPAERFMEAAIDASGALMVGAEARLPVRLADAQVRMALGPSPRGMRLVDGVVVWTPESADIGPITLRLILSAGSIDRTCEFRLTVVQQSVAAGFPIAGMAAHADAAVVCNDAGLGLKGGSIALLDVARRVVVAQTVLDGPVACLGIDAHQVYAGRQDSDVIEVLSRADLKRRSLLFTTGRPVQLACVADRLLFVATDAGSLTAYAVPGLRAVDMTGFPALRASCLQQPSHEEALLGLPCPYDGRWWARGILFDASLQSVVAASDPSGLPRWSVVEGRMTWDDWPDGRRAVPLWFRRWAVDASGTIRHGSRNVGALAAGPGYLPQAIGHVLASCPAVASVEQEQVRGPDGQPRRIAKLAIQDLITAAVIERTILARDLPDRDGRVSFVESQGRLAIALHDRVYVLPSSPAEPARFAQVLRLAELPRPRLVDGPAVELPLPAVTTPNPPVDWILAKPSPYARVSDDGTRLIVALADLREAIMKTAPVGLQATEWSTRTMARVPAMQDLAASLGGRRPLGVPVWVSFPLLVRDAAQQVVPVDMGCIVDIPPATLLPAAQVVRP